MNSRTIAALSFVCVLCVAIFSTAQDSREPSLVKLFEMGQAVIDTNGDNLQDALNAIVCIPKGKTSSPWHAAAAAEVAARLGFETTALSFPVAMTAGSSQNEAALRIRIGLAAEFGKDLFDRYPGLQAMLTPGRGAVLVLDEKNIAIIGADGPGLHNAAAMFAGRWPNAWEIWGEPRSTKLAQIEADVRKVLADAGLSDGSVTLDGLLYEVDMQKDKNPDLLSQEKKRNLDGMAYNEVEVKAALVSVREAADPEAAARALEAIVTAHRRGEKTDVLNYQGVADVYVSVAGAAAQVVVPRFSYPARLLQRRPDPAAMQKPKPVKGNDIDLSAIYSLNGLFADEMKDRIPDRIETTLVLSGDASSTAIADLAARLSLECAGASFPIAAVDLRVDLLEKVKQPILIGEGAGTDWLVNRGKLHIPELAPGEGYIALVPDAFNESNAVVILGDADGIDKACSWLAENYPGIDSATPSGDTGLYLDTGEMLKRAKGLLEGNNPPGQLLSAIKILDDELVTLERRNLAEVRVEIYLDRELKPYEAVLKSWLESRLPGVNVTIQIAGRRDPKPVFEETKTFEYEVDDFRKLVETDLLPRVSDGDTVALDVLLSEPKTVLDDLATWLDAALKEKGATPKIRLLCAYKQGFHWLRDDVLPKLRGNAVDRVVVTFKPQAADFDEIRKFYPERSRWLSELYPIDEVFAAELGIDAGNIIFEMRENQEDIYTVEAFGADGGTLLSGSFSPKVAERSYLDKHPDWAVVTVPTGWCRAAINGEVVLDQRILTDPERLWDYYQQTVLKKTTEHIEEITGKKPTKEKQPFFNTLKVEAALSEPNERIGIDEELISSIESLHEDIYFDTLDMLNGMVPREAEELPEDARYLTRIGAPGTVLPYIREGEPGKPAVATFTLLGNKGTKPLVKITWKSPAGEEDNKSVDIKPVDYTAIRLSELFIKNSKPFAIGFSASAKKDAAIERLSVSLPLLRQADAPGYLFDHPALQKVAFHLESGEARRTVTLDSGGAASETSTGTPAVKASLEISEILDPEQAIAFTRSLGDYPGVHVWRSGRSYQGRDVWSLEITSPTPSTHISRAKLVTQKPSILITGRQHANEVSSSTHILKLAQLLATDEKFRDYRNRINIILHPMENPDGAALVGDLIALNPNHMNHAGRYTSLGTDLGTQLNNPETLLTEALVRPMLWDRWLPDIYLNCHGYPSHEWVQQFSDYSPYQFRDYWIPRGWFVYLTHLDDPRSPEHRKAGQALLKYIDTYLTSDPKLKEINDRIYNRYWRWSARWQPHIVNFELHGGTMMHFDRMRDTPSKPSARNAVTALEGTPEAMDETPGPQWMETVVSQGLYYLEAHLRLLLDAKVAVEQLEEESGGRVHRTYFRKRPVFVETEK